MPFANRPTTDILRKSKFVKIMTTEKSVDRSIYSWKIFEVFKIQVASLSVNRLWIFAMPVAILCGHGKVLEFVVATLGLVPNGGLSPLKDPLQLR